MAEVRVTALPAATSLENTDVLHGVQSADARDKKFSLLDLKGYMTAGGGTVTSVFGRSGDVVAVEGDYDLTQLGDVDLSAAPTNGQALLFNGTTWVAGDVTLGTVTSVTGTAPIQVATGTTTPVISVTAGTEAAAGVLELATAAETTTGTDATRAVHPAGLKVELDKKAPLASPALTGTPTAPTAAAGTNTTQIATTAFVLARTPSASETVSGIVELATAAETTTGTNNTRAVHPAGLKVELDKKAPLASPTFTGTPAAPTAAAGTNTTQVATTAFVTAAVTAGTPAASETVRGIVELATAAETTTGTDSTRAVHPAGLKVELNKKAPLASPALTGTPTAPTAAAGTNTTQIATTAYVMARTPAASETVRGIVELATAAETTTGTDATRAVHPAGLRVELLKKLNLTGGTLTGGIHQTVRTITSGAAWNLNTGNLWTFAGGSIANPTNATAGMSGLIRITAAVTGWGTNFRHPGGTPLAPAAFPAVVPFYVAANNVVMLGSAVEGIA